MRVRLIFILVAALLVGAIAVQNWPEFTRSEPLSLGLITIDMSIGLLMLTILGVTLAVFLVSSAALESRHLLEHRRHARALHSQRELAEKAESSRFTDLRQHLDTHLRESRQRDALVVTEFEKAVMQSQREIRDQIEQLNHMLSNRLGELESRAGSRPVTVNPAAPVDVEVPVRERVRL